MNESVLGMDLWRVYPETEKPANESCYVLILNWGLHMAVLMYDLKPCANVESEAALCKYGISKFQIIKCPRCLVRLLFFCTVRLINEIFT